MKMRVDDVSTTYHLVCTETNEYIWIGQSKRLYTGQEYLDKLTAFLYAHQGKNLMFVSEHSPEYDDCTCFAENGEEWEPEKE